MTTTIKTDPDTGLPELPAGQWWEVRPYGHRDNSSYWSMFDIEHGLPDVEVAIRTTIKFKVERKIKGRWPWSKPTTVLEPSAKDETVACCTITRATDGEEKWRYVTKDDVTAAEIREAAAALLKSETQKAASRKLLGQYPPKRLPA